MVAVYFVAWVLIVCLLLPWIEKIRYEHEYGKKENLNKKVTVMYAALAWLFPFTGVIIDAQGWEWRMVFFILASAALRGFFWDPSLNLWLDRHIDDDPISTNSKTDWLERKWKLSFWKQRGLYLLLSALFILLYYIS